MNRVTGIGGIFFKAQDQKKLAEWYQTHLGIELHGRFVGSIFNWRDVNDPQKAGMTVWSIFKQDSKYFDPSTSPYMINYRVENLDALLEALRAEGVTVDDQIVEEENGRFGWIMDPEGNRIELWEPAEGK